MSDELLKTQRRIAGALERIADCLEEERDEYHAAVEEASNSIDPHDCPHPVDQRYEIADGAFVSVGCRACGGRDILNSERRGRINAATGLL